MLSPVYARAAHHRTLPSRRDLLAWSAGLTACAVARRSLASPLARIAETLVSTPGGRLRGELLPGGVRQFRGVRFAQPPTGALRFRPPEPATPWQGVRDALNPGPAARQPAEPGLAQSEDCLFLNLWTPPTPGPHPVFVWIHGGGYTGGNSFAPLFNGSGFAAAGIICVTVAYRLGAFGFLDLGPPLGAGYEGSANNGTRDVVEALRWVHDNIAAFGGDPGRVTVGGESAGAKLTATLMALPEAQPLFHAAISESGGGERVLTREQAAGVAQRFGGLWLQTARPSRAGHPAAGPTTLRALHDADPLDLLAAQRRTIAASPLHFPFRPEVDGSYLRGRPVDLVAQGSAHGKRLLIGTNRDESALFLGPHPAVDPTAQDLGNLALSRFNDVFPRYAAIYPGMTPAQRRIRAVSAEEYWVPSVRLADAHVRAGGTAWMYRLDLAPTTGRLAGEAAHASELDLVWDHLGSEESADPAAVAVAHQMHTAWCRFLHGETPAAPGLPAWPAYTPETRATLLLDRTSRLEERPAEPELHLWDGVL